MPVSKHYKKGQTARQFRKKRNLRLSAAQAARKTEKLGALRAMQVMNNQIINQKIKENENL